MLTSISPLLLNIKKMKRFNLIVLVVCAGLFLNINSGRAQSSEKLADKILNDHKLDTVLAKAKQLLSRGFNSMNGIA